MATVAFYLFFGLNIYSYLINVVLPALYSDEPTAMLTDDASIVSVEYLPKEEALQKAINGMYSVKLHKITKRLQIRVADSRGPLAEGAIT